MYSGSTEFNNLIEKPGGNALITRLTFADFTIENLVKLEYYGGSNNSDDIAIGTTNMAYLDVSAITDKVIVNDEFLLEAGMELSDGTIEYAPMGYFTVQKPDSGEDNVSFRAYDRMQKLEKPYFSALTYPTDSAKVLNELCTICGVELATPIANPIIISENLQGYTCREVLGYIAGIHGLFACFDRYGKLNLRWYDEALIEKQIGLIWSLTKAQNDYQVEKITLVKDTEITYTSGTGISGINHSNPYATQNIADSIYASLGNFTYRPCEISMLDDIRFDPWDMIKVTYLDGSVLTIPVMSLSHSFTNGDTKVKSFGKSDTENEYSYTGPITQAMDRMATELLVANRIIATKVDAEWVNAHTVTADELEATNARVGTLETNSLTADSAVIKSLQTDKLNTSDLNAETAKLGYLTADSAVIKGKLDVSQLSAEVAKLGYLSAEQAEIGYAKIDFSNVGTQVVSSSMIVDGAVTNEKVANLSANKITSGTIDASKINVTNLNADNLTVGTINGQRIGKGSLSLDKLSEEVATKEYLDSVQKDLQGQIDGAIETFTKSEIPTLNNEPANAWTDNETRKKHIGDVCYVLNPTSSADGYCYRFANLGTESSPSYSWVLIKDSDVTKALQDIIDINGEIKGIKQFDNEISSWKTDTDNELSSIKARTSTLETEMGTKVESTTFNTLKQTVDENSSSITSLSTTVSKKADSSTVTELSNTVNSVKQTADTNTSSISSMKTEFNNLEIGGRNYFSSKNRVAFDENNEYALPAYQNKGSFGQFYNLTVPMSYFVGKNCKLSFDAISPNGDTKLSIYNRNGNPRYLINENVISTVSTTWTHQELTITVTDRGETYSESFSNKIEFYFPTQMGCKIRNVKFELGNKATDWTPAPEDVEAEITSVQTIATQTADKFNWLVKSGTSATDFTLTDRTAELVSEHINLNGLVTFSGLSSDAVSAITDTIEVGGRNLLRFTDKLPVTTDLNTGIRSYNNKGLTSTDDGAKLTFNSNANTSIQVPFANELNISSGQKVTLSFDYRGNITSFGMLFLIRNSGGDIGLSKFPALVASETEWQHYEYTFSHSNSNSGICTSILMFYNLGSYGSDKWIEIKKGSLQLEKGNKVTDWTPALEDISVENVYTPNTTTIDGGKITTGTIKADAIDVTDLFSQNITATNFNMAGGSIHISANSGNYDLISLRYNDNDMTIRPHYIMLSNDTSTPSSTRINSGSIEIYEDQGGGVSYSSYFGDRSIRFDNRLIDPEGYEHTDSIEMSHARITFRSHLYEPDTGYSSDWTGTEIGSGWVESPTIRTTSGADLDSVKSKLDSLILLQKGQIPVSGGMSTNISAPTTDGYTFQCWINVSSNGFVGSPYIAGAENMEAIIWDNHYTTNTSLTYDVMALYVKN